MSGAPGYGSRAALLRAFDAESRKMGFSARAPGELEPWRSALRAALAEVTGMDRMALVPPRPELLESVRLEGYRRDKLAIDVEDGVRMPFYALVPDGCGPSRPAPCAIAAHGHLGGGKAAVAGVDADPAVAAAVAKYNYDYGRRLALEGFLVLCPDARGMGERREPLADAGDDPMGCTCRQLANMGSGLGRTVTGMWTWDLMRLADYALARGDCDASRLSCLGFSSGGQQALWLAAMDDRIGRAIVGGYFYGYRDSLLALPSNCSCNYVPRLWELADMGDLGALVAPRPLRVESGTADPLNGERGIANALEQASIARAAYALLGAEGSFEHRVFEGGHVWHGAGAAAFLLGAGAQAVTAPLR